MVITEKQPWKKKRIFDSFNWILLTIVIVLSLMVVYSAHTSRTLTSKQGNLLRKMEQMSIRHDQLMLEEGTFARITEITKKAKEQLLLQNLTLEQVVE